MKLTYVGPYDEVEVPSAGVVCKNGESVEVPDEVAGAAPQPGRDKVPAQGDEFLEGGKRNPKYRPEVPVVEEIQGTGLLAQTSNWQVAAIDPEGK